MKEVTMTTTKEVKVGGKYNTDNGFFILSYYERLAAASSGKN